MVERHFSLVLVASAAGVDELSAVPAQAVVEPLDVVAVAAARVLLHVAHVWWGK